MIEIGLTWFSEVDGRPLLVLVEAVHRVLVYQCTVHNWYL